MRKCAICDSEYDEAYDACPQCARQQKPQAAAPKRDLRPFIGGAGIGLLALGVFLPIVSLPFVGSVNYFNNGQGDGIIILAIAAVSAVLLVMKRHRGLLVTGGLSVAMLAYTFFALTSTLAEAKASLESEMAGNMFAGLAGIAMQSVQIQWGWIVLVAGALLLLAAGLMKVQPAIPIVAPESSPLA